MEYAILMAHHADGYCLFDSAASDFAAPRTGPGRDLVQGFVEAFRAAGLRVGLGYHLADWQQPAYFAGPERDPVGFARMVETAHAQVRELCNQYRPIDMLWLRGGRRHGAAAWRADELVALARSHHVAVLTDGDSGIQGDLRVHGPRFPVTRPEEPWAWAVPSAERHWGHHAGDREHKPARGVIRMLATTAGTGASLMLNAGLREDGSMPLPFFETAHEVGAWLRRNSAAIHHTAPGVLSAPGLGNVTMSGSTIYLHVLYWPGSTLCLVGLRGRVHSARLLADGWPLDVHQEDDRVILQWLPSIAPDARNTVIALEIDGQPETSPWTVEALQAEGESLCIGPY
jgi:alpha-L-fucosidase